MINVEIFKKIYKYAYLYPLIRVSVMIRSIYYRVLFYLKRVNAKAVPDIKGKFRIMNNGSIMMGNGIRFYSSFDSNPIGMSKYCSIYTAEKAKLTIGDNCGFSAVSIYCSKNITIGHNLFCGANVSIWDTDFHPLSHIDRNKNLDHLASSKDIMIGSDIFIGANSIILKGVTIGSRSVVGAGSVVTKNIPPDEIWAGNPAKFIKSLV